MSTVVRKNITRLTRICKAELNYKMLPKLVEVYNLADRSRAHAVRKTGSRMIHHAIRGVQHTVKHSCRLINHVGGYYFRNPDRAIDHGTATLRFGAMAGKAAGKAALKQGPKVMRVGGSLAARSGVHIGKIIWTHGPKVAKHSAKFMVKSAIKSFKLFT